MTVPFISALPLRIPVPRNDLAEMLASWMDDSEGGLALSSSDCQRDLDTIGRLRETIGEMLKENGPLKPSVKEYSQSFSLSELAEKLHEYYHYLLELESRGMNKRSKHLSLDWESSIVASGPACMQTVDSFEAEKANLMWNLAALEAHHASQENLTTKPGWNKASTRLQKAASWLGHLLRQMETHELYYSAEMSPAFLMFWQALLMAQAQHCIHQACLCAKPMQLLLAKLAAAAVPLYSEVTKIAAQYNGDDSLRLEFSADLLEFAHAWGAYMSCQAEYHQSQLHKEKKAWGLEIARLDVAYQHAAVCKNLCDNHERQLSLNNNRKNILDELKSAVDEKLQVLQSRLESAQEENDETHKQVIPKQTELAEIRGHNLVKSGKSLSELVLPRTIESLFQKPTEAIMDAAIMVPDSITTTTSNSQSHPRHPCDDDDDVPPPMTMPIGTVLPQLSTSSSSSFYQKKKAPPSSLASQNLRTYVEVFKVEMNEIIEDLARATEDQSESARLALNEVHLPHSLTAYHQEQSGGGLPDDLWERVHLLQQDNIVIKLKQDLWELKDAADLAQETHKTISKQLDFDTNTDKAFREENPDFQGHDAWDAQKSFQKPLANYNKLLSSAQEGDSQLFQRLEQLDIEPKYNLLQFSKSQLDLLLPGAKRKDDPDMVVDTQHLRYLCGELVTLFQKKADLMTGMRNEFENYDIGRAIEDKVSSTHRTDQDYYEAMKHAQNAFGRIRSNIQNCMDHQNELLGTILMENEAFMNSRKRTTNSQSAESCIVMIEDAMDEIDQLSKHLKEGKDFYNVVIPKLDELKQQVDDVSARLAVERLEYCETEKKASQEQKDAEMAQQLNNEASTSREAPQAEADDSNSEEASFADDSKPAAAPSPSAQAPSAVARAPVSNVDDEKVATLVAMEFDADKVVEALEKHNNNMDLALNELLSC